LQRKSRGPEVSDGLAGRFGREPANYRRPAERHRKGGLSELGPKQSWGIKKAEGCNQKKKSSQWPGKKQSPETKIDTGVGLTSTKGEIIACV